MSAAARFPGLTNRQPRGGGWLALCMLLFASAATGAEPARALRLSAAATAADTGMIQALIDDFRLRHPQAVIELRVVGALAALEDGRKGRADLVITHYRPAEEQFVEAGLGLSRVQFMTDEFALFGPPNDPLKISREAELITALKRLALAKAAFLSPAPQSGTARRLAQLWETAGVTPNWPGYENTGVNAAATLHQAAQLGRYTFANLGTYLANREVLAGSIAPLYRDHALLRNPYSAIVVNPARVPGARAVLAQAFLDYLVSDAGQELIARHGEKIFRTHLFVASAHLDPSLQATRRAREADSSNLRWRGLALLAVTLLALSAALVVLGRRLRRAEAARRASEERFALAVSGTSDALWDWNMQTGEVYFSPRWKELLGYVGYDDEIENGIDEWKTRIHPDDRELVLAILDSYIEGRSPYFASQHRLRNKRGDYLWVLERGRILWDPDGKPLRLSGAVTDITERRLQAEQAERQSLYDALTELPNRSLFLDRMEHAVRAAARHQSGVVVLVVNLNRFQEINDSHGHRVGDRALQATAQRLRDGLRRVDTAARLASDEFGVLLPDSDVARALLPLQRLLQALERPLELDGESLALSASVGVAQYPEHGESAEALLQHAYVAMYQARRSRTRYSLYHPAPAGAAARVDHA